MIGKRQQLSPNDRKIGTILVYLFILFFYVRLQEIIPPLAWIRFSGTLFLIVTIWGLFHLRSDVFKSPLVIIFLLGIVFFLSGLGAVNNAPFKLSLEYIIEVFPQCVAIYIIINSKDRIITFLKFWVIIYFCMALITLKNGGRGPGDFTFDENDAALALVMGLPFCVYALRFLPLTKLQILLCKVAFLVLIAAIVVTSSRGGFLGLVAVLLLLWWFSKKKLKIAVNALLIGILISVAGITLLPDEYMHEIQSIEDTDDNTRVERFRTWEVAWIMYIDNPVIGVGANGFRFNASQYQRQTSWWTGAERSLQGRLTHSLHFQVLSEVGTIGALLYLYIFIVIPLKLNNFQKKIDEDSEDARLLKMFALTLIVSMGGFFIAGAFISVAYYPHIPIWVTMYAIFLRHKNEFNTKNYKG
jgi:probable O-glycosylation ligase (exosortase A-associated)